MGLLDLLRKRETDRELSAREYVDQAVEAAAIGKDGKLDVGKLELQLQATGWTLTDFEAAVDRQTEINRLHAIVQGKADAAEQFKELARQAKAIRENNDAEIARLNTESDVADVAAAKAQSTVNAIATAEQELRKLVDSEDKRAERTETKANRTAGQMALDAAKNRLRSAEIRLENAQRADCGPRDKAEAVAEAQADINRLKEAVIENEMRVRGYDAAVADAERELITTKA